MDIPVKEALGALVTLTVAAVGYLQWKRTKRSGRFIEDRETAYKTVWQALEDVHLYTRAGAFEAREFDDLMTKANTLVIQHGLHISAADKTCIAIYIKALQRFGEVLSKLHASEPARHEIATTGAARAVPPELAAANQAYEAARNSVIERFRRAIGAGQI